MVWIVLCFLVLFCSPGCEDRQTMHDSEVQGSENEQTVEANADIHLYFADRGNGYLMAEGKRVPHLDDKDELGAVIIKKLIDGPQKALMPTIPAGTLLRAFYTTKDGTAYVDLSKEIRENHPGGARSELMTIYSIVNSIILNIPEIDSVKILVDGREEATLAGHIDLRFPLKANMLLIR